MATKKQFTGFTAQQMEAVAKKMGHDGPMDKFNEFLAASPAHSASLSRMTEKAKAIAEGTLPGLGGPPAFKKGGTVIPKTGKPAPQKPTVEKQVKSQAEIATANALNNPMKAITPANTVIQKPKSNELIRADAGDAGKVSLAHGADDQKASTADEVERRRSAQVHSAKTEDRVREITKSFNGVQGEVSDQAQVKAAQAKPSANATVQGQLENLMKDFEGGETPAWAAGAMRLANTAMAQRGLGASTMAGSAITQAAMESAIGIAAQDAATYSTFEMKNLDNRQQAALQNAQAFLTMDLQNLSNKQEATMFKTQARVQSLFNDQAAENASRQFNASSRNQTNQFFASLKTQVQQFNTAQRNSMKMFNTEQGNAVSMFNTQQRNARDEFNANNGLIIAQSNAKWRQTISTNNNAQQNETNRLNAQLATGMTQSAMEALWQKERDIMSYVFTGAENAADRANQLILQKMSGDAQKGIADDQNKFEMYKAGGSLVASLIDGMF